MLRRHLLRNGLDEFSLDFVRTAPLCTLVNHILHVAPIAKRPKTHVCLLSTQKVNTGAHSQWVYNIVFSTLVSWEIMQAVFQNVVLSPWSNPLSE